MSAEQAFRDCRIDVPASAKVLGYYAWPADDEYPMAAVLRMPCSAVSRFVSGSGLGKASSHDEAIASVQVFARSHGWSADAKDDRYLRTGDGGEVLSVLVHRTGTECTAYLDN
ncbi:hypothetical protein [Streptomyces sp. NPDC001978]|uniref:hypothetical protein n=1 Tax=Streptomyces sp. NPDC001978 TaxID=3364627 RepID=UPI0036A0FB6F